MRKWLVDYMIQSLIINKDRGQSRCLARIILSIEKGLTDFLESDFVSSFFLFKLFITPYWDMIGEMFRF